jgi:hypothetical protein
LLTLIGTIITSFLVDNSTIDFNSSAQLKVKNGGVTTAKLANLTSITFEQRISNIINVINKIPTVNTVVTIPNSEVSTSNFILSDWHNSTNVGGVPQIINSDMQFSRTNNIFAGTVNLNNKSANSDLFINSNKYINSTHLNNGQLLIESTVGKFIAANLTSSGGTISIINGASSINLETSTTDTFSNIVLTDSSNQIFSPENPNYGYTIPNVGKNSTFVLVDGN